MKVHTGSMNKTWKNAGLIAIGVGLLAYPAFRLYKYFAARNKGEDDEVAHFKVSPSYRSKHKPPNRKADANKHAHNGLSDA